MRRKTGIILFLLLAILAHGTATAATREDSLVLNRVFNFTHKYTNKVSGFQSNVYIKHIYQTERRNFTLWCVPSMYAIAHGQRSFVSEQYSRLNFSEEGELKSQRQVYYTTIPHNRRTMPTLLEFITPTLYDETIYNDHILSPFHKANRVFYHYSTAQIDSLRTRLYFRPRYVTNTQLVRGQATVETSTGHIMEAEMNGEFDMIHFQTLTQQGDYGSRALLPQFCRTNIEFKFMGNHITSAFEAAYDCPITLPDTVNVKGDRQLIDSVRPYNLSPEEQAIYDNRDSLRTEQQRLDSLTDDTLLPEPRKPKHNHLKHVGWDLIGENLLRSLRASSEAGYVKLSPIINPQYFNYSRRKGFSYRFKLGARLNLNEDDLSLSMNTRFGYNFKQRKFYFELPLRLNYLYRGREAHTEVIWGSGNRLYNTSVLDELKRQMEDPSQLDGMHLDQFDDWHLDLTSSLPLNNRLAVEGGFVFHQRKAVNKHGMEQMGMPAIYRSIAPALSVKMRPWRKGPLLTVDYERGLKNKKNNYLSYERWEIDASQKINLSRMKLLNLRMGAGFYTKKTRDYFMDYTNFRDENLPGGWDDDWSGNFQLLESRMYNESDYYVRGNISYESPLMAASLVPFFGRYVERERVYISSLSIAHTRLYSELGYGFTCRYFSMGLFASFLNTRFQESGAKFTFELFRRW